MNAKDNLWNLIQSKKIAIVGNALSIFGKGYGAEIDSHHTVCRINQGGKINNARHQGSKTNIWAYNTFELIRNYVDSKDKADKFFIHLWQSRREEKETKIFTDYFYEMQHLELLKSKLGHRTPSSGLMLINLVAHFDPECITLFGFDWNKTPTYYHNNNQRHHRYPHNFQLEKYFIQKNYIKHKLLKVMK